MDGEVGVLLLAPCNEHYSHFSIHISLTQSFAQCPKVLPQYKILCVCMSMRVLQEFSVLIHARTFFLILSTFCIGQERRVYLFLPIAPLKLIFTGIQPVNLEVAYSYHD